MQHDKIESAAKQLQDFIAKVRQGGVSQQSENCGLVIASQWSATSNANTFEGQCVVTPSNPEDVIVSLFFAFAPYCSGSAQMPPPGAQRFVFTVGTLLGAPDPGTRIESYLAGIVLRNNGDVPFFYCPALIEVNG